jgi:hypothetical protein
MKMLKIESHRTNLHKLCGAAALILLAYSLVTMLILVLIGGQPETALEGFNMLQKNRLVGLLRLDMLAVFVMPLYYPLFLGLYTVLKNTHQDYAKLGTLLVYAGLTMFLATPSVFSWLALSDKFATAVNEEQKILLLAAGEAVLASDMWHGTGPIIGGILMQTGALLISAIMVGSKNFAKATVYVGIVTHGLDLLHILVGFFSATGGIILMAIAGPLYLVWFPLIARDFFRLSKSNPQLQKER